jgi:transcription antitermination factor NusG
MQQQAYPPVCDPEARSAPKPRRESSADTPVWYALRVRSRFDSSVAEALTRAGVEVFAPVYTEARKWSDRTRYISRPLFPGYLFARLPVAELHIARRVSGVVQVIGAGSEPIPLSDCEIDNLRLAIESHATVAPCPYVTGETVRVESGPLAGVEGVISRTQGAATLVIRIEILHRAVCVQFDAADVARA